MFASIHNETTGDDYTDACTCRLARTVRIFLQVANNAVIYQLDESDEGKGLWTEERFLTPTVGSLDRNCSGIRFRSAVAGSPAQVSVEMLDRDALAGGADSVSPAGFRVDPDGSVAGSNVSVPLAGMIDYWGTVEPGDEFMFADGRTLNSVSDPTLASLYALIGTLYGGTGPGDFRLPDTRGRVQPGLSPGGAALVDALGDNDGRAQAVRSISHRHVVQHSTLGGAAGDYFTAAAKDTPNESAVTTGDASNVDYPAYIVCNKLIRVR